MLYRDWCIIPDNEGNTGVPYSVTEPDDDMTTKEQLPELHQQSYQNEDLHKHQVRPGEYYVTVPDEEPARNPIDLYIQRMKQQILHREQQEVTVPIAPDGCEEKLPEMQPVDQLHDEGLQYDDQAMEACEDAYDVSEPPDEDQ